MSRPRAAFALSLVFVLHAIALAWWTLFGAAFWLPFLPLAELVDVRTVVGPILSGAEAATLIVWLSAAKGTRARSALVIAATLAVAEAILEVLPISRILSSSAWVMAVPVLVALPLSLDVSVWLAARRTSADNNVALSTVFLLARFAEAAATLCVSMTVNHPTWSHGALSALTKVNIGAAFVAGSALLAVLHVARRSTTLPSEDPATPAPSNDISVGLAWLVGGLTITLITYAVAPGGKFVLTTGAIVYGLVRLFRGIARRSQ